MSTTNNNNTNKKKYNTINNKQQPPHRPFKKKNKKLSSLLLTNEETIQEAQTHVQRSSLVHQTNEAGGIIQNNIGNGDDDDDEYGNESWHLKQRDILQDNSVDLNSQSKVLSLHFPNSGEYSCNWTHNGRHLVMGSKKGHVAVIDTLRLLPQTEIKLKDDIVRDVTFFHNETLFATAQRKHVYVYSGKNGVEIHKLKSHIEPTKLTFLRYHFLLTSVSRSGYIHYQDVSTGDVVATLRSKMGPCHVLAQNTMDAIVATGHDNGVVARWIPSQTEAVVKMFCHQSPITAIAFDTHQHMITAGLDGKISIWDARKFGKIFSYDTHSRFPVSHLAISQRGLLAWSNGCEVKIWKDGITEKQNQPYLVHQLLPIDKQPSTITSLQFRPYEDVLAIGHSNGLDTILVPGAGEPNYDVFEANPFIRSKQRNEIEVHQLLDKIPWDTIGLGFLPNNNNSMIKFASSDEGDGSKKTTSTTSNSSSNSNKKLKNKQPSNKMKGRGKIGSRLKAKADVAMQENREKKRLKNETTTNTNTTTSTYLNDDDDNSNTDFGAALRRFL
jgi:U3 small nucleolar RNA-associated protein 7